ncbi:MAG: YopX family protein [Syntrophorhabdaceae bacterium]|nr:YopX family protein [Syntrophorhabdaceae bacterium]
MREIKFRAWDREQYEMSYSDPLDDLECASSWFNSLEDRDIRASGNIELMQYTGLKDKNGKEIYEGDIGHGNRLVSFIIVPILGGLSVLNIRFFGQEHNELIALPTNDAQTAAWLHESEVIGNIYENPELLKDKE